MRGFASEAEGTVALVLLVLVLVFVLHRNSYFDWNDDVPREKQFTGLVAKATSQLNE